MARACFIFDWDADEQDGEIIGIVQNIPLNDYNDKPIRGSSLIHEELGNGGWEVFLDYRFDSKDFTATYSLNVSGRFRWEGEFYASQDYWGEWDIGWDLISLEPANKKTRKAVLAYGEGWDELPKEVRNESLV